MNVLEKVEVGKYYKQNGHYYKVLEGDDVLHVSKSTINIIPRSVLVIILTKDIVLNETTEVEFKDVCREVIFDLGIYDLTKSN